MKRIIQITLLFLALVLPATADAYSFKANGIYYYITSSTNKTVEVTHSYSNGTSVSDYSGNVIIPSSVTYSGMTYSVTSIGSSAFSGCSGLTSVSIPNSVTSIGVRAFFGCSGLTSVSIGNSVTSIGGYAFYNCSGLTSVSIPNSVTSIGENAFERCSGLTSVNITSLETWLNISYVSSNTNPLYYAHHLYLNGVEVKDLVIPNTVTTIRFAAFSGCSGLTSVSIPNSVISIDGSAFSGCSGLTSVTIGNSVTSIGYAAFSGCSGLTSVSIPNSVISIDGSAFSGCSGLTSVTIGNSVTSIGSSAFSRCSGLTSVTIPNSVTSIGSSAFWFCTGLTSVTIPNSVTSIGSAAFSGCSGLTSINVASDNTKYDSRDNCNAIIETSSNTLIAGCKNTTIPNSVTSIGNSAFSGCSGLTSVTIPNSVTSIGSSAFSGCTSLATLNYNAVFCDDFGSSGSPFDNLNISTINIGDNVVRIPAYFAKGLTALTNVSIPNSVTSIGRDAFSGTAWYNNMPNGVVYAGLVAYKYKGSMPVGTSVTLRKDTRVIADHAFYGCTGLTDINIPNFVITIGSSAFYGCSGLTSVSIGNSVTSIGSYAFEGCSGLTDVYSYITDPQITMGDHCFYLSSWDYTGRTLHVPHCTVDDYQAMPRWRAYFASIVEMDAVAPALDYAFDIPDTTVQHGETIVIPVRLTNSEEIMAFQTDLFLPEGFSLAVDEDDEYMVTPSGRLSSDHILMTQDVINGAVRVLCYAPNGTSFMGNEGDLFYLHIQVPDNAGGDYTINLRNTLLTTSDYNELSIRDAAAVLTVNTFIPGDVNDSHTVTVTDIVATAQYIMELNPSPFIFAAADMNSDENISVTDIALIAYVVNHPTMSAPHRMPALTAGGDRMSGEGITLMAGETRTVSITLDNAMDYSAFQLDLMLPEGLTASNFQLTDRAGSHALDVNALANGKTRVLCYSPAIAAIEGHSGALLTFDVTANAAVDAQIAVDGIELVTTDCRTVLLDGFTIGVNNATGVNVLDGSKTVSRIDYYNLAGQRVERPESGVTLKVTTYIDGTRTTTKVFQ